MPRSPVRRRSLKTSVRSRSCRIRGDLIAGANQFDIANNGFRFTRNGAGGYSVSKIDATFRTALGTRLTLTDDDSVQADVPFSFPFYGVRRPPPS